ncbi:hypothetical protein D6C77_00754 [Aureobasidium pullulans]|nr:hypothetical protein D6D05_00704 [Aureobasidium pullulans]THY65548.1 hypothetical protein D6C98_00173 [Aureobasidium pullulans]TIA65513.1 hypothetical protein D6C77_00754 [Aureobasidium pullulans]
MKGILSILAAFGLQLAIVLAHTVITYPPWRGNNLITNGTEPQYDMTATGENCVDGQKTFPYGQQWMYPCGGMPMSHKTAMFYVNIGINGPGEVAPPNMSHPVVAPFQITGPTNVEYPGSFCLPQVPLVPGVTFNIGDNVTIQVIELAQHGAAIYNCADVTLADPADVPEVNASNCFNSSDLSFQLVYATGNLSSSALPAFTPSSPMSLTLPLLVAIFAFVLW